MAVQTGIARYICPSCGGAMQFDPKAGKLKCPYCDTVMTKEELEAQEAAAGSAADAPAEPGDAGWGSGAEQMKGYVCSSCGAKLTAGAHTVAARCPYCGSNAVTSQPFRETRRPDYVIPFKTVKNEAVQKYRGYIQKRKFLPAAFTRQAYIDEIQGVYVPFWLFSGRAEGEILFTATDEDTVRKGDSRETTETTYEVLRAGDLAFSRIPADASERMPDDLMDSLEPYDYSELRPFDLSYLPGFLAESFDVDGAESEKRADQRITNTFRQKMEQTVKHEQVRVKEERIRIGQKKTEYALLPVWLLSAKWNDKTYTFVINGQSGEMTGNLPVDNGKKWGLRAILFVVLLFLLHLFLKNWAADIIAAAVVSLIVSLIALSGMRPVSRRTQADSYTEGNLHLTREEEQLLETKKSSRPVQSAKPAQTGKPGPLKKK